MTEWATLSGNRIVSGSVGIPHFGAWFADVVLAVSSTLPTSPVTLTISDLTLTGYVERQFSFSGSRSARLVGGFGGWQKTIGSRSYQNPAGVQLVSVLSDAASDCGEKIGSATVTALQGTMIGTRFSRESMPAARVLKQLGGPVWWIDSSGATQLVDRTTLAYSGSASDTAHLGAIASAFNVITWSGGKGRFTIATETFSDWMPGRTFTSPTVTVPQTIGSVMHTFESDGKARTEVLSVS